jgi:hypothetical protein
VDRELYISWTGIEKIYEPCLKIFIIFRQYFGGQKILFLAKNNFIRSDSKPTVFKQTAPTLLVTVSNNQIRMFISKPFPDVMWTVIGKSVLKVRAVHGWQPGQEIRAKKSANFV